MSNTRETKPLHSSTLAWIHIGLLLVSGLGLSLGYWILFVNGSKPTVLNQQSLHLTQPIGRAKGSVIEPIELTLEAGDGPMQVVIKTDYRFPVDKTNAQGNASIVRVNSGNQTIIDEKVFAVMDANQHVCVTRSSEFSIDFSGNYRFEIEPGETAAPVSTMEFTLLGRLPTINYAWPIIGVVLIVCAGLRFLQVFGWSRQNWKNKLKNSADTVFQPLGGEDGEG